MDHQEECKIWKEYRERIKPLVIWMKKEKNEEKETSVLTKSFEILCEKMNTMSASRDHGLERLVELFEKTCLEEDIARPRTMARVVKPAKVPTWM